MLKAFLRDHKARDVFPLTLRSKHESSSGDQKGADVDGLCDRDPGHPTLKMGPLEEVDVWADGEDCVSRMSAQTSDVSIHSKKGNKMGPSPPGNETLAWTKEARKVLARLQHIAEM